MLHAALGEVGAPVGLQLQVRERRGGVRVVQGVLVKLLQERKLLEANIERTRRQVTELARWSHRLEARRDLQRLEQQQAREREEKTRGEGKAWGSGCW